MNPIEEKDSKFVAALRKGQPYMVAIATVLVLVVLVLTILKMFVGK